MEPNGLTNKLTGAVGVRVELAVRRLLTNLEVLNMHIDDWLDAPAKDGAEKWAKEFLEHCRRPASQKDYSWIGANPLFCTYKGERWRVVGASRMGDVWLSKQFDRENGYDIRPDVDECSDWGKDA